MESWRLVLRKGFLPGWGTEGLERLLRAALADDKRLIQGATTTPPPLMCVQDWPMEAADVVTTASVRDWDVTVGEAEASFAKACFEADQRLGEPAACRWLLNWWDDGPRPEVLAAVAAEVELELLRRRAGAVLDPALAAALLATPGDFTLWRAVSDYFRERGDDEKADAVAAGLADLERGRGPA